MVLTKTLSLSINLIIFYSVGKSQIVSIGDIKDCPNFASTNYEF